MLSTPKNVLFPGHNHLLTTGANDPSLWLSAEHQRVSWWIVAFLPSVPCCLMFLGARTEQLCWCMCPRRQLHYSVRISTAGSWSMFMGAHGRVVKPISLTSYNSHWFKNKRNRNIVVKYVCCVSFSPLPHTAYKHLVRWKALHLKPELKPCLRCRPLTIYIHKLCILTDMYMGALWLILKHVVDFSKSQIGNFRTFLKTFHVSLDDGWELGTGVKHRL